MTNTIFQSNNTAQLNSYFTQLVSNLMVIEKQPLNQITSRRDMVNIQHGAYLDAAEKVQGLLDVVKPLTTTSPFTLFTAARAASVSGTPTGLSVLSATATTTAIAGTYTVNVTDLAQEQRVRSDRQTNSNQALTLAGTIVLGGAANRSQTTQATLDNTVTGFGTAELTAGHTELAKGAYSVETRKDATAGWQFRLVDNSGQAVSIAASDGTSDTANWQGIPASGSYDTGRGLTLNLGTDSSLYQAADRTSGAATVNYVAQGAKLNITAGQSLNDIASSINSGAYAEGAGVTATVVDQQLVLASAQTGTAHGLIATDSTGTVLQSLGLLTAGGTYKNSIQDAGDAHFSVNGVPVVRGTNSGISDVVSGVTLNLAKDAKGQSATLTVANDTSALKTGIQSFISKFNNMGGFLDNETRVQESTNADGTKKYTPGTLSTDTVFSDLRMSLFNQLGAENSSGLYHSLNDLGLSIDGSMQLSIVDSTKLDTALANNQADVGKLFDNIMGGFSSLLNQFAAPTTGYLASAATSLNQQLTDTNTQIADMTNRLNARQLDLTNQFATIQNQLVQDSYTQQLFAQFYGTSSSGTSA